MNPPHGKSSCTKSVDVEYSQDSLSYSDTQKPSLRPQIETLEYEGPLLPVANRPGINVLLRAWWKELGAVVISIICLGLLTCMLAFIRNKPLADWKHRYQPNSVVSLLITVSRSAMLLSTASCLSQLAWSHFQRKPRRLVEFQNWDEASRGPLGAVRLLCHPRRYGALTILGSFITIATLLMDTFTQQVLSFPSINDPSSINATFPVTQFYGSRPNTLLGKWHKSYATQRI